MHKILLDNFLKEVLKEDIGRGDLYMRMQNNYEIEAYILARENVVDFCQKREISIKYHKIDNEFFITIL